MFVEMLISKIHRATITDADINYVGSITIDEELLDASGIRENQKVEIYDINNGERFSTYAIKGKKGTGQICINGAAARKVYEGDKIIICAFGYFSQDELDYVKPTIVHVDEFNRIVS
ncbi:MAG: aspartate 1-decarboxylase [Candidatus Gastranaerophilaceae bacterium]|jgi:aspartate 1-decarboxylase